MLISENYQLSLYIVSHLFEKIRQMQSAFVKICLFTMQCKLLYNNIKNIHHSLTIFTNEIVL